MKERLKIHVRRAEPNDLAVLLEFEQRVIEEERPYNDAIRASDVKYYDIPGLLTDPDSCLLVAEVDGRVVGSGYAKVQASRSVFVHDKHTSLGFMYVEPDFRGKGINKVIIESLLEWSEGRGVPDFYLGVYADNRPAVRAYEKVGFKPNLIEMKLNRGGD